MTKWFVFEEWHDYDSGGVGVDEFPSRPELEKFLSKKCEDKTPEEAKRYLEDIMVIEGQKRCILIKEVIKKIEVKIS